MDKIKSAISKNITELRRKAGMTQAQLAEKLNYSDKAISKWERGESIPDIIIIKQLADLFGVTVDYMISAEHTRSDKPPLPERHKVLNHAFITGMSIILVWLIATLVFVILDLTLSYSNILWLCYVYAIPVTMIVWLVFNSIWFARRRNFLIVSLLMWTVLIALHITLLAVDINTWPIFMLGIPGQAIILMWSKLRFKTRK